MTSVPRRFCWLWEKEALLRLIPASVKWILHSTNTDKGSSGCCRLLHGGQISGAKWPAWGPWTKTCASVTLKHPYVRWQKLGKRDPKSKIILKPYSLHHSAAIENAHEDATLTSGLDILSTPLTSYSPYLVWSVGHREKWTQQERRERPSPHCELFCVPHSIEAQGKKERFPFENLSSERPWKRSPKTVNFFQALQLAEQQQSSSMQTYGQEQKRVRFFWWKTTTATLQVLWAIYQIYFIQLRFFPPLAILVRAINSARNFCVNKTSSSLLAQQ